MVRSGGRSLRVSECARVLVSRERWQGRGNLWDFKASSSEHTAMEEPGVHLQQHRRRLLPGSVLRSTDCWCQPLSLKIDESLGTDGCPLFASPFTFRICKQNMGSQSTSHRPPSFSFHGPFFFMIFFLFFYPWMGVGKYKLKLMLSPVPKGPGATSATGHLPPPTTAGLGGGKAQGQKDRAEGPECPASLRALHRDASPACDLQHIGHPSPARSEICGWQRAAGTRQMGCGARRASAPSSAPRLPLPYPSPG